MSNFEQALQNLIEEHTGEAWPVTAFVLYAMTTDPETMTLEEPFSYTPEGQRTYVTRGLLEQAKDELTADINAGFAYVDMEDDEDD